MTAYPLEETAVPTPPLDCEWGDCSRPGAILLVRRADVEWFVNHEEWYVCGPCAAEARAHLAEGRNWYDDGAVVDV